MPQLISQSLLDQLVNILNWSQGVMRKSVIVFFTVATVAALAPCRRCPLLCAALWPPPWIRGHRDALSLPLTLSLPVFVVPETLALPQWQPWNRRHPSCVAASRSTAEQIEAGQTLRLVALVVLVQGIGPGSSESSPSISSSSPLTAAV